MSHTDIVPTGKDAKTPDAPAIVDAKPADKQTLAQAVEKTPETPKAGQAEGEKVVPEGKYLKLRDDLKSFKKETTTIIGDLVKVVQDMKSNTPNQTDAELEREVTKLSDKWKANPDFVREMLSASKGLTTKEINEKFLKAKDAKEKEDEDDEDEQNAPKREVVNIDTSRLGKAVDEMLTSFLADMPEYKDIVNSEVIKSLVLANPNKNMNRTMNDLVEEVYGKAVAGKKGIDSSKPNSGKNDTVDLSKPLNQEEYRDVMADKDQRKSYVDNLVEKAKKFL